jgi:hypothetical protein
MYFFLPIGLEDHNTNHRQDLPGDLQENERIHPGLRCLRSSYIGMSIRATKGNRLNNAYEHLFRRVDATSAGHLLPNCRLAQRSDVPQNGSV